MSEIQELFELCRQAHQSGNLKTAAEGYAAILSADPGHADAWHLSGVLAHQCGRTGQAIHCLKQAIQYRPQHPEYLSNLSAVLLSTGDGQAALEAARSAVSADESCGSAWFQQARALARLNQTGAAQIALQQAVRHGFEATRAYLELAEILQDAGDLTGSASACEACLNTDLRNSAAWFALARLAAAGKYRFSERQIEQLRETLDAETDLRNKARLAFAFAFQLERRREFTEAFELFQLGNSAVLRSLNQQGVLPDAGPGSRLTDRLMALFSQDFISGLTPVSSSQRPILVIGMPRSGTSLVEQILARHPEVAPGGEIPFWPRALCRVTDLVATADSCDMSLLRTQLSDEWRLAAATEYQQALQHISDAPRVVDKLPGNFRFAGLIAKSIPGAVILHCCRDPRDTCLSCFCQLFDDRGLQLATGSLLTLSQMYRDYRRMMDHWTAVMPGRITDVCYERLVRDPESEVRRLLDACHLPWHPDCLSFHRSAEVVRTASSAQVRQPFYRSSDGKWRNYSGQLTELSRALQDLISDYEQKWFPPDGLTQPHHE